MPMMEAIPLAVAQIYVPVKRRKMIEPAKVEALANSILASGLLQPIQVRRDETRAEERFVIIEGLHRLEAVKSLGEPTIMAFIVQARRH